MTKLPKGIRIIHNPLLSERTTMRIGGKAIAEVVLEDDADIELLPSVLQTLGGKPVFLGEGSNIFASDQPLPLVLVRQISKDEPVLVQSSANTVLVKAKAGLRLPSLLAFLARQGLTGLEGLCGIPGSLGGAALMNAGSYGLELKDVLESLDIFTPQLGKTLLPARAFDFAYRSCKLKGCAEFLILGVTLKAQIGNAERVKEQMRLNYLKKQSTQPVLAWSAGCAFRNPVEGLSAGKLLEESGLKGYSLGGMAFSSKHANFLINQGTGSFSAGMELLELAKSRVLERTGYNLALEIKIWA